MSEARKKLYEICEKTSTNKEAIGHIADYYIKSLGWSEEQACEYLIGLFHNGTIDEIKTLAKGDEIK